MGSAQQQEIQAALAFGKSRQADQPRARLMRMALGQASRVPGGLAFGGLSATGWVARLPGPSASQTSFEEIAGPDDFQGTLRTLPGARLLLAQLPAPLGPRSLPCRRHGTGQDGANSGPGASQWSEERASRVSGRGGRRCSSARCPWSATGTRKPNASRPNCPCSFTMEASVARAAPSQGAQGRALVLSSYALLHRDFELLKDVAWAGVILDEAQNIKNAQTKQARAAYSLPADYRIALTGTPVENHVGDLWSIMEFLNPGFLGTRAEFKRTFFVPIQAQQDADAARKLQRLTGPFILRRLKTDKSIISDLPDKLEMKVYCNLTKEQASLYEAVVKDIERGLEAKDGIERKGLVLATLSKLKQVCNHPAQFLGDNSSRCRPIRQAGPLDRNARRGPRRPGTSPGVHPVQRNGRDLLPGTCKRRSAGKCCSCTVAPAKSSVT